MEKLIQFFRQHQGYAQMKDLKAEGFHTRMMASALDVFTVKDYRRSAAQYGQILPRISTDTGFLLPQ